MKRIKILLTASVLVTSCAHQSPRKIDEAEIAKHIYYAEGFYNLGLYGESIKYAKKVEKESVHYSSAKKRIHVARRARREYARSPYSESRVRKLAATGSGG